MTWGGFEETNENETQHHPILGHILPTKKADHGRIQLVSSTSSIRTPHFCYQPPWMNWSLLRWQVDMASDAVHGSRDDQVYCRETSQMTA